MRKRTALTILLLMAGVISGFFQPCTLRADTNQGYTPASMAADEVGLESGQSGSAKATAPGAPINVTAKAGNASATISFSPPASNGGSPILSYTVTSNPGGKTATKTKGPITVNGLTNGKSYTFTVTAKNRIGTGPKSSPSNRVTPDAPSVVGTWNVSGKASVTYKVPGYPTQTEVVSLEDTLIFDPDHSVSTGLWYGTWAQKGSNYTMDIRQSMIDYIEEVFAENGIDGTFKIKTYNVGGTVSASKLTFTGKIAGTIIVYYPQSISITYSETDIASGPRSSAMPPDLAREVPLPQRVSDSLEKAVSDVIEAVKMNR